MHICIYGNVFLGGLFPAFCVYLCFRSVSGLFPGYVSGIFSGVCFQGVCFRGMFPVYISACLWLGDLGVCFRV